MKLSEHFILSEKSISVLRYIIIYFFLIHYIMKRLSFLAEYKIQKRNFNYFYAERAHLLSRLYRILFVIESNTFHNGTIP